MIQTRVIITVEISKKMPIPIIFGKKNGKVEKVQVPS
jgi:hypothetical protein